MKRLILFLLVCSVASASSAASASVIAYWRFDDAGNADIEQWGPVAAGNPLPDSDGQTVWRRAAHDNSGNGNHLTTWDYAWAGFRWTSDVPSATVPLTGAPNLLSIQNGGDYPAAMTWSEQSLPSGVNLETITPAAFTIEASFKAVTLSGYHTIVGRDDRYVATTNGALASLYFQVVPGNAVAFKFTDVAGFWHEAISASAVVTTGQWYNMVGVSDGLTMSLYLDNKLLRQVDLRLSGSPNTALALGSASGGDWQSGTWSLGRGLYNGGHVDRWVGYIDEVRISDNALNPSEFLQVPVKAEDPIPADGSSVPPQYAERNVYMILDYTPGIGAVTHTAYFSDVEQDVIDRDEDHCLGSVPPWPEYSEIAFVVGYDWPGIPEYARAPLVLGRTYYWCIDEFDGTATHGGDVWSFTVMPTEAWGPSPADGEELVSQDPTCTWHLGNQPASGYTFSYNVYCGTDEAAVAAIATGNTTAPQYKGNVTTPTIVLHLDPLTEYFWRVDTLAKKTGIPPTTTYTKGAVWSFTTGPAGAGSILREIWQNITPTGTAISLLYDWPDFPYNPTTSGTITEFDSPDLGLAQYGGRIHGWLYAPVSGDYTFYLTSDDNGQLWLSTDEDLANAQLIASESSYRTLYDWAASGEETSVPITLVGGKKYYISALWKEGTGGDHCAVGWKVPGATSVTIIDGRYLTPYVQYWASDPLPPDESNDVERTLMLSWEAGAYAAAVNGHKLYFSPDHDAVMNRTVTGITRTDPCYPVTTILDLGKTYYWAVDEVNNLHLDKVWPGDLWSFTTINYLVVDDMEKYVPGVTDPNIYEVWVDGAGDCKSITGNNSGALVYISTLVGLTPVHGGQQAMKLMYDNDGTVDNPCPPGGPTARLTYSKAEAQVAKLASGIGSDWTAGGVTKALSLWFYGDQLNSIEPMWVQLTDASNNKAKVLYGKYADENVNDVNEASWHEWLIDLADFTGVNVANVKSIAIGIGNEAGHAGGSGTLYFDDIRLYTPRCVLTRRSADFAKLDYAPEADGGDCVVDGRELEIMTRDWLLTDSIIPAEAMPPAAHLLVNYRFEMNTLDSSTNALHGTPGGAPTYELRAAGDNAIVLSGSDYVNCGNPPQLDFGTGDWSVCAWIKTTETADAHTVFAKGGDQGGGIRYTVAIGENGPAGCVTLSTDDDVTKLQAISTRLVNDNEWHHVVGQRAGTTLRVYVDAIPDGTNTCSPAYNLAGASQHNAYVGAITDHETDPTGATLQKFFVGSVADLRIYDYALTQGQIITAAGLAQWHIPVPSPAELYEGEAEGSRLINFKDYAVLTDRWLEEDLYP